MSFDNSDDKIKEISEILYNETILPGKQEAQQIIEDAKIKALEIIHNAKNAAKTLLSENEKKSKAERAIHSSSIKVAIDQALASLKADVMNLFHREISENMKETLSSQDVCVKVVDVLLTGIKEKGIFSDLTLYFNKGVNYKELSDSVIASVVKKLEKGEEEVSSGIALLIKDKKMTLKVTEQTFMNLFADNLPELLKSKVFA
jgi:V/A-type H+/Na+-transporting ATPase subunit E